MESTTDDIQSYLNNLRKMLQDNSIIFRVSNSTKNTVFKVLYNINDSYIKTVLMQLTTSDFVKKVINNNPNFEENWLFIFNPILTLPNALGVEDTMEMYVKISINEGNKIIVVSFHEAEYKFKGE